MLKLNYLTGNFMRIVYESDKVKRQCEDLKTATKLFGGDKDMAIKLMSRINAIEQAVIIKDIIAMPPLRFHKLRGKMEGLFAIDVKSRRDPWRIIIQPLDENEKEYKPCNIDEIAGFVKIVGIKEVSQHYE